MRTTGIATLLVLAACQYGAHANYHHAHGAWSHEEIDATDWAADVKQSAKARSLLPGMSREQVEAAWGKPDSVTEAGLWVYRAWDDTFWDGAYIPQRTVRFDASGRVADVTGG